jgi:phosphinothricin acetyltransferase
MAALIEAAEQAGYWKLLSRIFFDNTASRALMAKLGSREVGIYHRHGKLDGVWRDCVIVERLLGGGGGRIVLRRSVVVSTLDITQALADC